MDDVDVVPAGDIDNDAAAALIEALVQPSPPAAAAAPPPVDQMALDDEDVPCAICSAAFPPQSRAKNCNWISCDSCKVWFHNVCVGLGNRKPKLYKCANC